jgi:hypothetical protein
MFHVEVARQQNLMVMRFAQRVGPEELQRNEEKVLALLKDLAPGFQLLSDLSGLESMDPACLLYIRRIMDRLNTGGVSKVVRVIPDPHRDIGLNILSLFHYGRRLPIVTCQSLAEAMQALAAASDRQK